MDKFLESENIYLKKLSVDDDLTNYLEMVNEVKELLFIDDVGRFPLNKKDLIHYIDNVSGLFLSIFNINNEHVGNIRVTNIHPINKHCSLGILLNKNYRSKGYAKEACKLVIEHLFMHLNVHRIELYVASNNIPAIKLYENLGFIQEGIKREAIWINGKYDDLLVYSTLFHEFRRGVNNVQ